MNPEIKSEWTAKLRSGEYTQGTGVLRQRGENGEPDTYCCLGVLCELGVKAGVVREFIPSEMVGGVRVYAKYDGAYTSLPDSVREWAGLESSDPVVKRPAADDDTRALSWLNDIEQLSFREIADIIDAQL